LVEIEAIPDDKLILDGKSNPAGLYGANPFAPFTEENANGNAAGAQLFGVAPGSVESEAGIEDIVDEKDVPPLEIPAAMFQPTDFSGGLGAFVAGDAPEFDLGIGGEVAE